MAARITRREFLRGPASVAVAALVAPLVTACGGPSSSAGVSTGKPQLEMWAFSQTRTAWQQRAFKQYYSQGDGRGTPIKYGGEFDINFLVLPYSQMHDKMMITAWAGQGGPDIVDVEISRYSQFIKGGTNNFVKLNDYISQHGGTQGLYTGSATDPWSWQGAINGMGNELNACAMAYRHDLYDKFGIQVPIKTYEDLAEAGKKVRKDSGGQT